MLLQSIFSRACRDPACCTSTAQRLWLPQTEEGQLYYYRFGSTSSQWQKPEDYIEPWLPTASDGEALKFRLGDSLEGARDYVNTQDSHILPPKNVANKFYSDGQEMLKAVEWSTHASIDVKDVDG